MYKTLLKDSKGRPKSSNGRCVWESGKWKKVKRVKLCDKGFHCSELILDAMGYVTPEFVAEVEVRGESDIQEDKQAWSEMKLVKVWEWTKEDSVSLAIYGAELCIKNFEKVYPEDKRPREAIQAAKKYLKNPTYENRQAAWSAESAAESAWSAARSAAWSAAESAAESARSAAWSAAESAAESAWSAARSAAESAAESAWSAAWSAARSAAYYKALEDTKNKINKWIIKRLESKDV